MPWTPAEAVLAEEVALRALEDVAARVGQADGAEDLLAERRRQGRVVLDDKDDQATIGVGKISSKRIRIFSPLSRPSRLRKKNRHHCCKENNAFLSLSYVAFLM